MTFMLGKPIAVPSPAAGGLIHLARTTGCWAFAVAVSLSLLVPSAAAQQNPTATAEDNFAAGFISGCLESRRGMGLSERHARAHCVCTVSEFRASLSDDEFRVFRTFNTLSDDLLVRLGRSALECETVGTYDTVTGPPESQLLPARRFERFSIRLPQGFIPNLGRDPDGEPAYMFFRFHADHETSATINGGLIPIVDTRLKGKMLVLRRLPSTSCRR